MTVVISQLFIYPVKSLSGLQVSTITLDALGAVNDRRYMLVDDKGLFITQRQFSALVLIKLAQVNDGWLITLPDAQNKCLPRQGETTTSLSVTVWGSHVQAFDQGDEWADWFSAYLKKPVRLVYCDANTSRLIDKNYCSDDRQVSFADGFPLLLTNESSLAELNSYLSHTIPMQRFRPNIVVSGKKAFAENGWKKITSSVLELDVVKPCSRCVIPTINAETGEKESDVWQALDQLCRWEDNKIYFGQNVIHSNASVNASVITVGDVFSVIES